MYNWIGVHEAPGLLKEGGGVINKILSESLSVFLSAVAKKISRLPCAPSLTAASCNGKKRSGAFRIIKKGGEKGTVIDKITTEEKYFVTLIRRMEVKQ